MKLGFWGEQPSWQRSGRRTKPLSVKEGAPPRVVERSPEKPAERTQAAYEIGARFEYVNEKIDDARQVVESLKLLSTILDEIHAPICDEFRERQGEHSELQAALANAESMRQRLEAVEHQLAEMTRRTTLAETALADAEARLAVQETALRDGEAEIEQLKRERGDARAQLAEAEEARSAAARQVADLIEESAASRLRAELADKRCADSEAQAEQLRQQRLLVEQERDVFERRLEQAVAEAAGLAKRVANLDEMLAAERRAAAELDAAKLAAEAETTTVKRLLEAKLEARGEALSASEVKLETALARAGKLDELNADLRRRLGALSQREKSFEDEKANLLTTLERAEACTRAREQDIEALRRDALALEAARAAAVQRADDLARLAATREAAVKRAERLNAALKDRLEATQADHAHRQAVLDGRLSNIETQFERERAQRAMVEGALETARRDRGLEADYKPSKDGLSRSA
jgi:crescentin